MNASRRMKRAASMPVKRIWRANTLTTVRVHVRLSAAARRTAQISAAVDSGTLDPDTLYVTGDADRFASWQAQYGDKTDYITWDIAAAGIYDRRDEYYFMAPKQ